MFTNLELKYLQYFGIIYCKYPMSNITIPLSSDFVHLCLIFITNAFIVSTKHNYFSNTLYLVHPG